MSSVDECSAAVLDLIAESPQLAIEVWAALVAKGYTRQQVRSVIAQLWDHGLLNVGLDQRLRAVRR
jgi:hypothetical protein